MTNAPGRPSKACDICKRQKLILDPKDPLPGREAKMRKMRQTEKYQSGLPLHQEELLQSYVMTVETIIPAVAPYYEACGPKALIQSRTAAMALF
ncbi:hypothetical protein FOXYSP1_08213 [Fusarium oxysporum f. sp. phaseoli]